jgi:hypothetical protein
MAKIRVNGIDELTALSDDEISSKIMPDYTHMKTHPISITFLFLNTQTLFFCFFFLFSRF